MDEGALPAPAVTSGDAAIVMRGFTHAVAGQTLRFIPDGPERLAALLALIADAQVRLRIIVYMFEADHSGTLVRDALAAAAERGVAVTLILDSFGSGDTADGFFAPLVRAGGQYRWFSARWTPRYLIRNHLKLYIADDDVAMFGGFNVSDEYFAASGTPRGWHDLGVVIAGSEAAVLGTHFDALDAWSTAPRPSWAGLARVVRDWTPGAGQLRWLPGGPSSRLSSWARAVKRDLDRATRLDMIMAYFSPSQSLLRRIGRIGRRGHARLVLAGKSDNGATIGAARALYGFLLKRDVEIAEYQPDRLHLKLLVVDNITYIGSANFDMRSLFVNLELMLRVDDAALADTVRTFIAAHAGLSTAITAESHRRSATWLARIRWALAWFMVSAVDYGVTRRLNLGLERGD